MINICLIGRHIFLLITFLIKNKILIGKDSNAYPAKLFACEWYRETIFRLAFWSWNAQNKILWKYKLYMHITFLISFTVVFIFNGCCLKVDGELIPRSFSYTVFLHCSSKCSHSSVLPSMPSFHPSLHNLISPVPISTCHSPIKFYSISSSKGDLCIRLGILLVT